MIERLLPVELERRRDVFVIRGFIGKAGVSRQARDQQFVFVNGRAVENAVLSAALREGYHTALMKGSTRSHFFFSMSIRPRWM